MTVGSGPTSSVLARSGVAVSVADRSGAALSVAVLAVAVLATAVLADAVLDVVAGVPPAVSPDEGGVPPATSSAPPMSAEVRCCSTPLAVPPEVDDPVRSATSTDASRSGPSTSGSPDPPDPDSSPARDLGTKRPS
ncbi:hypothetical protein [Micromonospora maritima]